MAANDYYPFGGTFNSYTSGTENKYKFVGNEWEDETSVYDFGFRRYDPTPWFVSSRNKKLKSHALAQHCQVRDIIYNRAILQHQEQSSACALER